MPDGTESENEQNGAPVIDAEAPASEAEPTAPEVEVEATPSASMPDQSAALADLAAQVAKVTGERDAAIGQAVAAQAIADAARVEVENLKGEAAILRERLLSYELGAAIASAGLPSASVALVRALYAAALREGCYLDVGAWLAGAMSDPNHPAAALALMRPAATADPRNTAAPMNGSSATTLKKFPIP